MVPQQNGGMRVARRLLEDALNHWLAISSSDATRLSSAQSSVVPLSFSTSQVLSNSRSSSRQSSRMWPSLG